MEHDRVGRWQWKLFYCANVSILQLRVSVTVVASLLESAVMIDKRQVFMRP